MKAIVAVDLNWAIGNEGKLLKMIPEDMKHFKNLTTGKTVVMGRQTFESLPNQEPLKDRVNIVISKSGAESLKDKNVLVLQSVERLLSLKIRDIFVIGGESIYKQLLPYCNEVYVTMILDKYTADRHFPNLNLMKDEWEAVENGCLKFHDSTPFVFFKYKRISPVKED